MDRHLRVARLRKELERRVLVLDGAMGTALQALDLRPDDFGGPALDGCNEHLVLTRPDVVRRIHRDYFTAGADIIETNTFGGTPLVLAEYGLEERAAEINRTAAQLARAEANACWSEERPRFVAGSMGPTTKAITVTGGVTFEQLVAHYSVQARALLEGGVDYFLVETVQDTRNAKAALLAIADVQAGLPERDRLPVAVSVTIEATGTMLAGQSVEALVISLEHVDLLYLGLNCATGPEFMTDHLRTFSKLARTRVACVPNAGLPDENGRYLETPQMLARSLARFGENGWVNLVGGCCGTHAGHIQELAQMASRLTPRLVPSLPRSALSGVDALEIGDDVRPVVVGERTNVLGSRKFRDLIAQERWEEAAEVARAQVKRGAHMIDVSTQQTDRDEVRDLERLLGALVRKVRVPLMIDSTNEKAVETALTYSQGKSLINSVNLEDGERRFEKIVPLVKRFGAALVVGCIDERGQAIGAAEKLAVARRSHELLTVKYGVPEEDLYFDPLVFPCASGDAAYTGSAIETIDAVRGVKSALPRCKTVLGISNVSFGLPAAGREVVNSVFLYHCVRAGLDLALVNSEKLERYPSIPEPERELAEGVLFSRDQKALQEATAAFTAHFREKRPQGAPREELPLDERLQRYIVEGARDGLLDDLAEKLREGARPLEIINGPLMRGMDEVGRLFNDNQLIVAEVLQSAEAMKAAVAFLEPHMDRLDSADRGKLLLATVKGDVHDIGKNLVEIILGNNGFRVINLGIKVPPEKLIAAVREQKPDLIGLSGLLVKSAHQMVTTAADLKAAGIDIPLLVGGAALSRNFVDKHIAPAYGGTVVYAQDAMAGLDLARTLRDPEQHRRLVAGLDERRRELANVEALRPRSVAGGAKARAAVPPLSQVPAAPDFERHVLANTPLDHIWSFVNPVLLYGRHLGLKDSVVRRVETCSAAELAETEAGRKALALREHVEQVKSWCRGGRMQARAVYQFFRAESEGDRILLYEAGGSQVAEVQFPRQDDGQGLCLSDYVSPRGSGLLDTVCAFVVTAGSGIRDLAESFKRCGEYVKSHVLQALALETAEAYAELLHSQIRNRWGFPDPVEMAMTERFKAAYRGKRYSFGYPACPRLDDQRILFEILRPEEIGVQLTDGFMMDPEASVSALVFHHPDATYFSVGDRETLASAG
jgi:5-methyltetrahydrofolate--homocysteine methyltransferase